jgi:phytoene dehydrogenase-like protein
MNTLRFDVVVAGSGIGGLCAAALLARHGYKVLLVERLERLGGRFSTIEQDGFKTPTGAMMVATRRVTQTIYEEVGARFIVRELGPTTAWLFGKWHELPEKGQIRALLSVLEQMGANKTRIMGRLAQGMLTEKISGAFRSGASNSADPSSRQSFRDWLKQYTDDERVLQLFHALTSAISTVNDFEYPASHWFTYISAAGQGGMAYHGISPNGNIENANALADTVLARGGEVWASSSVKSIHLNANKVSGLVIEHNGHEVVVDTGFLVSDLGPKKTLELAGRDAFPAGYVAQVEALRAAPIVANIIASDIPLVKSPGGLLIAGAKRIVAGVPVSLFAPEIAPPGQHLTIIWGTPGSCLKHVDPEEEARLNREDLEEVFPEFRKHGRLLRQDIRDIDDEFPALRSWMGYDLPPKTPVSNLLMVGDGVKPFGWEGLAACAESARLAVNELRKTYRPSGA